MRSVRIVARLFFLFLVSGFLAPPFGFPAGKEKNGRENRLAAGGSRLEMGPESRQPLRGNPYTIISTGRRKSTWPIISGKSMPAVMSKPNQPDIMADVYHMGSAEDAFGVFSLEHQDPEAGIGQGSEFGGSLLRFWKGRYFVTVLGNGTGKELEEAVLDLGRELAKGIQRDRRSAPAAALPAGKPYRRRPERICFVRSHVLLNRCFFISHQNILRLANDVQALLARYPQGKNKLRLLLIRYPTAARARSALCRLPVSLSAGGRSRRCRADGRRRLDQGGTFQ